jgi:hypothetical protein
MRSEGGILMDEERADAERAKARDSKPKHPYVAHRGEALDEHMRKMHGWSRQMIANRGTKTIAQDYHYLGNWHHSAHGNPRRPEPEADQ